MNSQQKNWLKDTGRGNPCLRSAFSTVNPHGLHQALACAAGDCLLETEIQIVTYKSLDPSPQRTKCLWTIIVACFESHKQHTNTPWGQDGEFLNVTIGGAYSYHWASNC